MVNKEKEKQTEQTLTFILQAAFMAKTLTSNLMREFESIAIGM